MGFEPMASCSSDIWDTMRFEETQGMCKAGDLEQTDAL